jgi:hypothetical protein
MKALQSTIERINWNHGRGDVTGVMASALDAHGQPLRGVVFRRIPSGQYTGFPLQNPFTIIDGGRKVRFLGRTRVIR